MAETSVIMRNPMVFINETHYVGRVKSVACEMTKKMMSVGGMGGVGNMEIPTGKYEPATASVEFSSIANGDVVQLNKNDGFVKLRMTAQIRMLDASSGTRIIDQAVTRIHGYVKNPPVPGYSDDGSPYTAQIAVSFIEILNTSGRIFMVDFVNGVMYPDGSPGEYGITVSF
ncbi:phage major tail tube protein [Enterovibrio nigricans]|uniref:Phage tail tube protein FII n=1 Tax=Enterovibrio nigricans DSM 22720 TaxID=1121868 RepID=A0A1T4UVG9_9GAMM|nr:phage major tail tube protein [Enterovibrio nigricans]PKF50921.1 hypothetical protein AT251_07850 [Enterovibrio nigricans]SKA56636.1 Phage tail tube protein FII [Enterovibrio nigricans DSM 22720]